MKTLMTLALLSISAQSFASVPSFDCKLIAFEHTPNERTVVQKVLEAGQVLYDPSQTLNGVVKHPLETEPMDIIFTLGTFEEPGYGILGALIVGAESQSINNFGNSQGRYDLDAKIIELSFTRMEPFMDVRVKCKRLN